MKELSIIVCVKQIPDPEAPLADVRVDGDTMEVIVDAPLVISPFDENALEAALQLQEAVGAKVTVLSLGPKLSDTLLRKSLAAGADQLILLQDDRFEKLDSHSIAASLADAIRKIGEYDLVLTGRQAGDWDFGQVGLILGEMLDLPCIGMAREIKAEEGSLLVKKSIPGGYEQVKAPMPALVTVSNELGELRYISRSRMMKMLKSRVSIPLWSVGDFISSPEGLTQMEIVALSSPPDMSRDCQFLEGATPDEMANQLAAVFRSLR